MSRECLLCEGPFLDGSQVAVVKRKGLQSFIEASKKRKDRKVVLLINFTDRSTKSAESSIPKKNRLLLILKGLKRVGLSHCYGHISLNFHSERTAFCVVRKFPQITGPNS
uniref:Uncharacterized protein n=1 Tax=Clastoptera arizonana TaxID=38151 RepID=A0A1B6C3C8_9HEMI